MSEIRENKTSERKPIDIPSIIFIIALSIAVLFYSYSYYQETMIKVEASKTVEQKQAEKRAQFVSDSIRTVCQQAKEKCKWCEDNDKDNDSEPFIIAFIFTCVFLFGIWIAYVLRPY